MPGDDASPSSSATTGESLREQPPAAPAVAERPSEAPSQADKDRDDETGAGDDLSRCPICEFIEAGECKTQHQEWVACRAEAKKAGKDYIEECQDHFKAFLQCAIDHRDYYEPFLEMLGGRPEDEQGQEQGQQEGGSQPGAAQAGDAKQ